MLTQNTYIDKRTIEGLTVGTYIISCFASKDNKSVLNSLKFSLFFICPALPSMSKRQIAYEKNKQCCNSHPDTQQFWSLRGKCVVVSLEIDNHDYKRQDV